MPRSAILLRTRSFTGVSPAKASSFPKWSQRRTIMFMHLLCPNIHAKNRATVYAGTAINDWAISPVPKFGVFGSIDPRRALVAT